MHGDAALHGLTLLCQGRRTVGLLQDVAHTLQPSIPPCARNHKHEASEAGWVGGTEPKCSVRVSYDGARTLASDSRLAGVPGLVIAALPVMLGGVELRMRPNTENGSCTKKPISTPMTAMPRRAQSDELQPSRASNAVQPPLLSAPLDPLWWCE